MKRTQLAHLRAALEARRDELENLLRDHEAIVVNWSADILDRVQHDSEREMAIGNLERESDQLREVRTALRRIHPGTFGICLDCKEEISLKRLSVVPWAASCLACREAVDGGRIASQYMSERPLLGIA
ncbi:MAG: TraR/DksA C4-type zinc finger protein [Acidobacteriales bacterium]|nr:TraR/DksA C4-type zinc finger protein [Terriglobales bacterium]